MIYLDLSELPETGSREIYKEFTMYDTNDRELLFNIGEAVSLMFAQLLAQQKAIRNNKKDQGRDCEALEEMVLFMENTLENLAESLSKVRRALLF